MKIVVLLMISSMFSVAFASGGDRYVGALTIALREHPDNLSSCVKLLKFGDKVSECEAARSALAFSGDRRKLPSSLVPTWMKVVVDGQSGYVPTRSLVGKLSKEDEMLIGEIGEANSLVAKQGFSETEDEVALVSMKGAAGDARLSDSATDLNDVLVAISAAGRQPIDDATAAFFLNEGSLHGVVAPVTIAKDEVTSASDAFAKLELLSKRVAAAGKLDDEVKLALKMMRSIAILLAIDEIEPKVEFALGLRVLSHFLVEYKPVPPADGRSTYLNKVGQSVARASAYVPFAGYRFVLVESAEANAFAVPGGVICVCTGLFNILKSEDELAAVLGHEIAHVEMRHGLKGIGENSMMTICSDVLGFAIDGDKDLSSDQVKKAINQVLDEMFKRIKNGYNADLEGQADWRSIQFLARIGYDPNGFFEVLERFKTVFGTYGGAKYPEKRGADVRKYIEQFGLGGKVVEGRIVREMRYKMAIGQ